MPAPAPSLAAPPRRRLTVPVAALLAALVGGFAWGVAMYAWGRHQAPPSVPPSGAPDPGLAAFAALNRVDEALAAEDAAGARSLLAKVRPPPGQLFVQALELRSAALAALDARVARAAAQRTEAARLATAIAVRAAQPLEQVLPDPEHAERLLALAMRDPARPGLAVTAAARVLRSADGGRSFAPVLDIYPDGQSGALVPQLLRHPVEGAPVFVFAPTRERLGWWSGDGGGQFAAVPPPSGPGTAVAGLVVLGGDRALAVAVRDDQGGRPGMVLQLSHDGGQHWQPGAHAESLLALLATRTGLLAVGRGGGKVLVGGDSGSGLQEAAPDLQGALAAPARIVATASADDRLALLLDNGTLVTLSADGRPLAVLHTGLQDLAGAVLAGAHAAAQRWYLLHASRGLLRSDDGGRTWRAGAGRLGSLRGRDLAWSDGLLIAGEELWAFTDAGDACFAP